MFIFCLEEDLNAILSIKLHFYFKVFKVIVVKYTASIKLHTL